MHTELSDVLCQLGAGQDESKFWESVGHMSEIEMEAPRLSIGV